MLHGNARLTVRGRQLLCRRVCESGWAVGEAAFAAGVITPLIAAIFGKPDFGSLMFTINHSTFKYGLFINALIAFVLVAAAVYFAIVVPMNAVAARRAKGDDPTTKECPECLSEIPIGARRCSHCTSELSPTSGA